MKSRQHNLWDIRLRVITIIVSIAVVSLGIYQFNQELRARQEAESKRIEKEAKSKVYMEIASSIGEIIALSFDSEDVTLLDPSINNFEKLYFGKSMMVIKDTSLSKQMRVFRLYLINYRDGFASGFSLSKYGRNVIVKLGEDLEADSNKKTRKLEIKSK